MLIGRPPPYGYRMPDPPPAVRPATAFDAETLGTLYRPYVEQTVSNFQYEPSVAPHERLGFVRAGTFPQVGFKGGQWVGAQ